MAKPLPSANRPPPANHLLAALPGEILDRVVPQLDVIPLKLKRFLHKAGEPIHEVYFPGGGFISMVTVLNDGGMVEVATVGREGVLGVSALLNGDPSPSAAMGVFLESPSKNSARSSRSLAGWSTTPWRSGIRSAKLPRRR